VTSGAAGEALARLRAVRRRNGTAGIEPFDAFYQAYVTALLAGMGVLMAGSWLGDDPVRLGRGALAHDGAAVLGILSALVVGAGVRSGARGGPFAVEAPDVRHVLLAPVPRDTALRVPAVRQLRFLAGAAIAAGAVAGVLAPHRLPGGMLGWMAAGGLWALATVAAAVGAAWCAAGVRLRPSLATVIAAVILSWSGLAAGRGVPSPTTQLGMLGVLPLRVDVAAIGLSLVLAAALLVLGWRLLGRASVERVARRSSLVGELRFAATMRDLRTVIVLRRQLTQELPRSRPLLPVPGAPHLPPVVRRDLRALVRTPLARAVRLLGALAAATIAAIGIWQGTTALLVVAGLAAFVAGLELLEPLAQDLDHPDLVGLAPVPRGRVHAAHLVVPSVVLTALALAVAAAVGLWAGEQLQAVALLTAACAGPAAIAGAAGSVLRDADPGAVAIDELAIPPEAVGMRLLYKTLWPPALAAAGFLPVVVARSAAVAGGSPAGAATNVAVLVLAGAGAFAWWVRARDDLRARWDEARTAATTTRGAT